MKKLITLLLFCCFGSLWANDLQISQATISGQNSTERSIMISFDISWQNSWRNATNYDGVWLFVKFQKTGSGEWFGATLSTNSANHNPGTAGSGATIVARGDGKGVFFHRAANGSGDFGSSNVQLKWNYGSDALINNFQNDVQKISVYGVEMCYVPQGAFYVGSGGTETNHFYTYGTNNQPYLINSEAAITVGTEQGNLYYNQDNQYGGDRGGPIPAAFPKGYNAFWCMKYEMTQEQYVDFLNTLTRDQQTQRVASNISGTEILNRYVMSNTSSMSYRNGIRCDANIPDSPQPITFYCDYNGNGVPNEDGDGKDIACNWVNWEDEIIFSLWSGLRHMTELEFEKACRGIESTIANEYVWGSTSINFANTLLNSGFGYESVSGNCNINPSTNQQGNPFMGPLKVGIFAKANTNREQAGSTCYGIMEMAGNLWESTITIGTIIGRNFNTTTVNLAIYAAGYRSGGWDTNYLNIQTSGRSNAADNRHSRFFNNGFRGVSSVF